MNFNQVDIDIGGKVRKLTASMQNLYAIEENVGSIYSLAQRVSLAYRDKQVREALNMKELINVIFYALNGNADNKLQIESIQNEVFKRGYNTFIVPVGTFLLKALAGGEAQEKGVQEPTQQQAGQEAGSTGNPITE